MDADYLLKFADKAYKAKEENMVVAYEQLKHMTTTSSLIENRTGRRFSIWKRLALNSIILREKGVKA